MEELEPMLPSSLRSRRHWHLLWLLPLCGMALVAGRHLRLMSRLELTGLYAAGYKLGVAYRICVDSKRCLKAASHEGARLSLVEKEEAEGFFVGGSRTAIILSGTTKGLCLQASARNASLERCKSQAFEIPPLHLMGSIRSEAGQCLQAKDSEVAVGPCVAGSSWMVEEVPTFYSPMKRYKLCNTGLGACVGRCDREACDERDALLVKQSKALDFRIWGVRSDQDVTALALFDEPLCLQGKNFECKGLCALKSHSQMRFEACNSTAEKFYLPFPPLSYGKLRWALYQDRCLTGLPSKKVDTLRCDPRAHNTWRLVPS